jgi:hypothetical protein
MFTLGGFILTAWVFCFFYYGDTLPRNWSVGMVIGGLFTMGWGLLKGKNL